MNRNGISNSRQRRGSDAAFVSQVHPGLQKRREDAESLASVKRIKPESAESVAGELRMCMEKDDGAGPIFRLVEDVISVRGFKEGNCCPVFGCRSCKQQMGSQLFMRCSRCNSGGQITLPFRDSFMADQSDEATCSCRFCGKRVQRDASHKCHAIRVYANTVGVLSVPNSKSTSKLEECSSMAKLPGFHVSFFQLPTVVDRDQKQPILSHVTLVAPSEGKGLGCFSVTGLDPRDPLLRDAIKGVSDIPCVLLRG